ncbi:class I SAM-dependent DNA methyltransferase [Leptolyngbya sp. O-77]|uniref:class I SAM-dependent DNA methyltransferase n=1 Tax=Leptolyngbya sp. O-77 TaxID=1080068 RepID=UPI00074D34D3|nr:DNA methyltransferase [Leptolyngbya sp. O-77]BAU40787.1 N-6 DNA Methylase [Leptolyngbya sp. O-77]
MTSSAQDLQAFVDYCQQHIRGDEKSEAQMFLTRFFQAFGHSGIKEAGAEFEARLSKGSKAGKMGFADLVWRSRSGYPGVVIEMKSRGEDLNKHYSQLERYWMRITPNRPRYALLCNFDEFWIFDFENQVDEPVDRISLDQLPQRVGAFTFMQAGGRKPVFNNNQVEVTERSARRMGELYQLIYERGKRRNFAEFSEETLQRFLLQCVMAMFAEDRGLLPSDLFVALIQDCLDGQGSTYDLIGGLFQEMNRKGTTPAGRYKGVDYFNGGLFAQVDPIELTPEELRYLDVCARDNWSNVRPSIFGNIFEGAIDPVKRHAHGIHFTSEVDIRQIVRPTISDYWEERINSASSIAELNALQLEMQSYRVLDPACGSGNFLYVAYQEMKRLEALLLSRIAERRRSDTGQLAMGFVTPTQFFGMDTNPFAVQLARVTMMIARKIAIDKHGLDEPSLPLDTLDGNIVCQDALFANWPKADAVIGNPPFLGGSRIRLELGDDYAERVFSRFSNIRAQVDFASYWFRLTHDHLGENGRAGLVATNSISQGKSRSVSLDYITQNGGYIHEAISTQPWSGEAKVHVSLVNWSKKEPHTYRLDQREVSRINSSLKSTTDVVFANRLKANLNMGFVGMQPNGKGFYISESQAKAWISSDPKNQAVLKPSASATDLTDSPNGKPSRWIIDFLDMAIEEISDYREPFEHIKSKVKPEREQNREAVLREKWWRFKRTNEALRKAISQLETYFIVPRHSKWFVFLSASAHWLPADSTTVVASDDFYVLGILTSSVHRAWVKAQSSTLKGDTRYTHNTCFETFPFPQFALTPRPSPAGEGELGRLPSPGGRRVGDEGQKLIQQIRDAAIELHEFRSSLMERKQWGITQLYNEYFHEPSSQLAKLHAKLDGLVLKAYGFSKDDDLLERLLMLNLELAAKEQWGEAVVGPWAPE